MHPANELSNLKRRVNRARRNHNGACVTCPASRHVHIMAEALAAGKTYHMITEEPEHCAGSLLSVLESLWKARARIAELEARYPI
jgi:hypothetical protein